MAFPQCHRLSQSRVFISYARKDGAALAQRLHQDLTDEGFVVWLDVQRLTGGDIWRQEIAEAIDRADVVLALLSAGSYTSDVCRVEQHRALEKGKCIIPIRVQGDCEIPRLSPGPPVARLQQPQLVSCAPAQAHREHPETGR